MLWKKKSPQLLLLLNFPFEHVFLIFPLFRLMSLVCSAPPLRPNNERKSDPGRKRLSHFLVCVSTTSSSEPQTPRGALDVCPAVISSALRVVMCSALCFDMYNERTRGARREVRAAPGVARWGRRLRSLWTTSTAVVDKTTRPASPFAAKHQAAAPHSRCTCFGPTINEAVENGCRHVYPEVSRQ